MILLVLFSVSYAFLRSFNLVGLGSTNGSKARGLLVEFILFHLTCLLIEGAFFWAYSRIGIVGMIRIILPFQA